MTQNVIHRLCSTLPKGPPWRIPSPNQTLPRRRTARGGGATVAPLTIIHPPVLLPPSRRRPPSLPPTVSVARIESGGGEPLFFSFLLFGHFPPLMSSSPIVCFASSYFFLLLPFGRGPILFFFFHVLLPDLLLEFWVVFFWDTGVPGDQWLEKTCSWVRKGKEDFYDIATTVFVIINFREETVPLLRLWSSINFLGRSERGEGEKKISYALRRNCCTQLLEKRGKKYRPKNYYIREETTGGKAKKLKNLEATLIIISRSCPRAKIRHFSAGVQERNVSANSQIPSLFGSSWVAHNLCHSLFSRKQS